jgi:hypothetical protein
VAEITIDSDTQMLVVRVPAGKYTPELLRFAAYLFLDRADPLVEPAGKDGARITLRFRQRLTRRQLQAEGKAFLDELDNQRLQNELLTKNHSIQEFIIRQALQGPAKTEGGTDRSDLELSEEEERELDKLIAEVEELVAKESEAKAGEKEDPMGIQKTWEEAHGKT